MSIILKGIDMPKHYEAVEVKVYISDIDAYGYVYEKHNREVSAVFTGEALDNIIQIPNGHGRIGDLDEVKRKGVDDGYDFYVSWTDIDDVPTILEAET